MSRPARWPVTVLAVLLSMLLPCAQPRSQENAPAPTTPPTAPSPKAERVLLVGHVHPVAAPSFTDGAIVVGGGRILAVGPRADVDLPQGVPVSSYPGAHAYPGFVDAWSRAFLPRAGLGDGAAGTDTAAGLDRYASDGERYVRAGITTAHVLPTASGRWLGRGTLIRPTASGFEPFGEGTRGAELLRLVGPADQHPVARQKDLLDLGRVFEEAEAYAKLLEKQDEALAKYEKDWQAYLEALRVASKNGGRPAAAQEGQSGEEQASGEREAAARPTGPKRPTYPKAPARDPEKEALLRVARGEVRLWIEAQRVQEVRAALDLLAERSLQHGAVLGMADGAAAIPALARHGVGVVLAPTGLPVRVDGEPVPDDLAAQLHRAGVPFAFGSNGMERAAELSLLAATTVGQGLPADAAVRAITLAPAELLGIAGEVGSLERGKRADVVIASAPILRSDARVLHVFAQGQTVYQAR